MIPADAWMRSFGTTRWMPLETRRLMVPRPPTMAWISSVHTPVAFTTCCARISSSAPDSRSTARTPATRAPSRRNPVTWTREAIWAPYCAAVRARVSTYRASSTWASQNAIAPVIADRLSPGTSRSAPRRDSCRCPGSPLACPSENPSTS